MNESFSLFCGLLLSLCVHGAVLGGVWGLAVLSQYPDGEGRSGSEVFSISFVSAGTGGDSVSQPSSEPATVPAGRPEVLLEPRAANKKETARKELRRSAAVPAAAKIDGCQSAPREGAGADVKSASGAAGGGGLSVFGASVHPGVLRPAVLFAPKPPYPQSARRDGFEGKVLLDVNIGTDGSVRSATIARSSSRADCDDAALKTILERWRFEPAMLNGEPVEWREKVVVSYRLK